MKLWKVEKNDISWCKNWCKSIRKKDWSYKFIWVPSKLETECKKGYVFSHAAWICLLITRGGGRVLLIRQNLSSVMQVFVDGLFIHTLIKT